MVGIAIGLLLIAGVGQIYAAAKHSYDMQSSIAELQDVGRYAIDVLTKDIRMAGYWDLMDIQSATTPTDNLTNDVPPTPDRCTGAGDTDWGAMITHRIFGINDASTNYGCIGTDRLQGDILTVRYAHPANATDTTLTPTRHYIRTAPLQGAVFLGSQEPLMPVMTPSADHALVAHSYFVSRNTTGTVSCATGSVTPPALARKFLTSNATPLKETLVNGVEQIQIRYGIQGNPASSNVTAFVDAQNVADWTRVMAVRLWVLARVSCPDPDHRDTRTYTMADVAYSPNDNYRRALFTATVSLRNCRENFDAGSNQYQIQC